MASAIKEARSAVRRHLQSFEGGSALVRRLDEACDPWEGDDEVVPLAMVNQIVGPEGPEDLERALRRLDCPVTPELFRPTAF